MPKLTTNQPGQSMVMAALMITVFFGILALVVDVGFVMVQRRQQQNAADAAALAVAKDLAASVGIDSGGNVNYVNQNDAKVMTRAQTLATNNWVGTGATQNIGIDYLDCNGTLIRAAVAGAIGSLVPQTTCMVRATGTAGMNTMFLQVLNPAQTTTTASGTATARIAPTSLNSTLGDLWPITRWRNYPGATVCWFDYFTPCTFWSSNGGTEDTSIGSWKEKIFPSKYSRRLTCNIQTPHQILTAFDPDRIGSPCGSASVQQLDMEYWFTNGFGGTVSIGNRIEVDTSGDQGNNLSNTMRAYLTAAPEGTDTEHTPSWGVYRTVAVALWDIGERWQSSSSQYVSWSASCGPSGCTNPPDRVVIADIRCFRFYYEKVSSQKIQGHYVACFKNGAAPGNGAPSGLANTVQMVN